MSAVKCVSILLVEVPAVAIEMNDKILGEVVLNHPKYIQLLLAENLRAQSSDNLKFDVDILDMKTFEPTRMSLFNKIDYDGIELKCWRLGTQFETLEEILGKYDIIGISASYTFERRMVCETIDFIKRRKKAPFVVVGGHDATADPKYYLRRGADICVLGEGETALYDIAVALDNGDIESVPGIAFIKNGDIRKNGKRKKHSFESIAFPSTELLNTFVFNECPDGSCPTGVSPWLTVLETSRGCDERCSFCDSSFIIGKYRPIPLHILNNRIEELKKTNVRTILFADDNLLYRILPQYGGSSGRKDLISFFSALFDNGFAWTFYNGLQFGLLEKNGQIDRELINALFKNKNDGQCLTGCFRAYIPLEKFTNDEMQRLPKLRSLDIEQKIVSCIAAEKVPELNLGFIIGNIRETPATIEESIVKARTFREIISIESNNKTSARFFPWCSVPIPGTPDYSDFQKNIVYSSTEYPELYSNYTSVLSNQHFSPLMFTLERERIESELNGDSLRLHKPVLSNKVTL